MTSKEIFAFTFSRNSKGPLTSAYYSCDCDFCELANGNRNIKSRYRELKVILEFNTEIAIAHTIAFANVIA